MCPLSLEETSVSDNNEQLRRMSRDLEALRVENTTLRNELETLLAQVKGRPLPRLLRKVVGTVVRRPSGHSRMNRLALHLLSKQRPNTLLSRWHRDAVALRASRVVNPQEHVAVLAVTYNSARWIDNFLWSIMGALDAERTELIVVDNGSTDETTNLVRRFRQQHATKFYSFHLECGSNVGFGQGINRAFAASKAPFILVTNVDTQFPTNVVNRALAIAEADETDIAAWELAQTPFEHPKYYDPVTLETSWNSGACTLYRREAFAQVNGYDKSYFMYGEDVDLSYRLTNAGWRLRYLPFLQIEHFPYEVERDFKPVQYQGSLRANAMIRVRFGSRTDALWGFLQSLSLPFKVHSQRSRHAFKAFRGVRSPLLLRAMTPNLRGNIPVPLRNFDYEMARDGAYYTIEPARRDACCVTVIIRTYEGRSALLREALASVLNQTHPNIELLVVQDGGGSMRPLVESVAAAYPSTRIRFVEGDGGRSRSGNIALAAANGEYIAFLDDDDLLFGDHIQVLTHALQRETNAAAAYALSWEVRTQWIDKSRALYREMLHLSPPRMRGPFSMDRLVRENMMPIQAVLFRRSVYEQEGGFNERLSQLEDWNLWVRYAAYGTFANVPKLTSLYRTPHDEAERHARHLSLHAAYEVVRNTNIRDLARIRASKTASGS